MSACTSTKSELDVVAGNLIGTKADGTGDLGNSGAGIELLFTSEALIDGTVSGAANVISGNGADGIQIVTLPTASTRVSRTVIRLNDAHGVDADGTTSVAGNVIFQNGRDGVQVPGHETAVISANQIFANGELGIDLVGGTENAAGVTSNDDDDPDTGLQNFPILTSATRSNATSVTTVAGTLNSTGHATFRIELFIAVADPSGNGEGQIFLQSKEIITQNNGDRAFSFSVAGLAPGMTLTATATGVANGTTSEFSANRTVVTGP